MTSTELYNFRAYVVKWIDGDTVECDLDLGFSITSRQRLRLLGSEAGVDTDETHDADAAKRASAAAAKARSEELAPPGAAVLVRSRKPTVQKDGFGRYLAEIITAAGESVGDKLLEEKLAHAYRRGV